ncbi:MAG: hypothetical protein ABID61_05435, partial [Candidatus Micrarchaeota archaeon]
MVSLQRNLRSRILEEDVSHLPQHTSNFKSESKQLRNKDLEFSTISSRGEHIACSAKTHQALRLLGCDNTQIRDTLHTTKILESLANRPIDAYMIASTGKRNRLSLAVMASLASISTLRAADIGVSIRSIARFYARNKSEVQDVDRLEKFLGWVVSRGESGVIVRGLPSEWQLYSKLFKSKTLKSKMTGFKSANKIKKKSKAKNWNKSTKKSSHKSKPSSHRKSVRKS